MWWKSAHQALRAIPAALADRLLHLTPQSGLCTAAIAGAVVIGIFLVLRRREHARARRELDQAVRLELHVPPSLHPVIDTDI